MVCLLIVPFFRGVKQPDMTYVKEIVSKQAKKIGCVQKNERDFMSMYHIKQSEYKNLVYYGPSSYLDVMEIMVVYAPDHPDIYQKVFDHIESQKKSFEGYGVEQTKLLTNAYVASYKDYVVCIVSNDETVKQAIIDLFH